MHRLTFLLAALSLGACFSATSEWDPWRPWPDGGLPRGDGGQPGPDAGPVCSVVCPAGYRCEGDQCLACGCEWRACGLDACGTSCGTCKTGEVCVSGKCAPCAPGSTCGAACCAANQKCADGACVTCDCSNRQCGTDACGNACGVCTYPNVCSTAGQCVGKCTCQGKACGDDGCGKSCGTCPAGKTCAAGTCVCEPQCAGKKCGPDGCGNTCGACPASQTCTAQGQCVAAGCNPACAATQRCESGKCVEICNPPTGCPAGQTCDVATGLCKAAPCDATKCLPGQGCIDPRTGAPGPFCSCMTEHFDASGNYVEDTCAPFGQVCDWQPGMTGGAKCSVGQEWDPCDPAIGCDAGLECANVGGYTLCLRTCAATRECPDPYTTCQSTGGKKHCWYAICADPSARLTDRLNYFKPCASSAAADGLCVPVESSDGAGYPVDLGLCVQTGTAAAGGKCDPYADRTSSAYLCPQGQYCVPTQPEPTLPSGQLGLCHPVCNAAPSPTPDVRCAAGRCLDLSGSAPGTMDKARLGVCFPACDLFGADRCATDSFGNTTACFPNPSWDGTGICWPTTPSAKREGMPCTYADLDARSPCGDRLVCTDGGGTGGYCTGVCNPQLCADPSAPCSTCKPSGLACYPLDGTAVGLCY